MGSFKVKLVLWFALLALLPLAVAFYGYDTLARRSEARRADAGLEATLRAAASSYQGVIAGTAYSAQQLANDPKLQRALRRRDEAALVGLAANVPGATIEGPRGLQAGLATGPVVRRVDVLEDGKVLGRVTAHVAIDAILTGLIGRGEAPGEHLIALRGDKVIAGFGAGTTVRLQTRAASRVQIGDAQFRGLRTAAIAGGGGVAVAALVPQHRIDVAARNAESRLLTALFASLAIFAVVTYLLGRSIVRTLRRFAAAADELAHGGTGVRVEVQGRDEFAQLGNAFNEMAEQLELRLAELETERNRVRDAASRFGEALAATHDASELLRVVVESAVEATAAAGGLVLGREGEIARAGNPDATGERIAFPLRAGNSDFGSLVLTAESFDADQVEMAASLAAHAVVALDNARLHRIVERQALVDSLTGLANRRSLEDGLRSELARAVRLDSEVCLVLADLDDFKSVNDRYGHPVGDEVLKEFAQALKLTVRESDVAGRWGGEEFALVLSGADASGGARLAERARKMIEERSVSVDGGTISVTASFGVAAFPEAGSMEDLVAAADSALYAAKRAGKNKVVVSAESATSQIV